MRFNNHRGVGGGGEMNGRSNEKRRAGMVSEVTMTYIGNLNPKAGRRQANEVRDQKTIVVTTRTNIRVPRNQVQRVSVKGENERMLRKWV